jgi:hypothetical protein
MYSMLLLYIALFKIRIKCNSAVYRKLQLQSLKSRWQPPDFSLIVNRTPNLAHVIIILIPYNRDVEKWKFTRLRNDPFSIEPEISLLCTAAIESRRWIHSEPNYSSPQPPTFLYKIKFNINFFVHLRLLSDFFPSGFPKKT